LYPVFVSCICILYLHLIFVSYICILYLYLIFVSCICILHLYLTLSLYFRCISPRSFDIEFFCNFGGFKIHNVKNAGPFICKFMTATDRTNLFFCYKPTFFTCFIYHSTTLFNHTIFSKSYYFFLNYIPFSLFFSFVSSFLFIFVLSLLSFSFFTFASFSSFSYFLLFWFNHLSSLFLHLLNPFGLS